MVGHLERLLLIAHISKASRMPDKRTDLIQDRGDIVGKRREAHSLSVLAERSSGLANGYDSAFKRVEEREGERVESLSFSFPRGTISVRPYRCFPDTGRTMEKERERERATPHEQRHAVQCNARSGQRETQPMQRATRLNVGTLVYKRERRYTLAGNR